MTTNITTTTAIELFIACGLEPADEFQHANPRTAEWFRNRYDALMWTEAGYVLAAAEHDDAITLALLTDNGVTADELRFNAPDGEVCKSTYLAFLAVAEAWS